MLRVLTAVGLQKVTVSVATMETKEFSWYSNLPSDERKWDWGSLRWTDGEKRRREIKIHIEEVD